MTGPGSIPQIGFERRASRPVNGGANDSGWFVGQVIQAAGVDPTYPVRGTHDAYTYMRGSEHFVQLDPDETLHAGDVIFFGGESDPERSAMGLIVGGEIEAARARVDAAFRHVDQQQAS